MELKEQTCHCNSDNLLDNNEIERLSKCLNSDWITIDNKLLKKKFPFANFRRGMAFAQEVALLAEQQDHHPDVHIYYDSVDIELHSHSLGGLTGSDFIMADKIDNL